MMARIQVSESSSGAARAAAADPLADLELFEGWWKATFRPLARGSCEKRASRRARAGSTLVCVEGPLPSREEIVLLRAAAAGRSVLTLADDEGVPEEATPAPAAARRDGVASYDEDAATTSLERL